jgi:glycosyltransferase involved in cell wall biosynthesis
VDLTRFHPAVDGTGFRRARALTAAPTLLHVGRLLPDDHVDELIEAVAVLRTQRNVQLLVVGDGPERARLEALAKARGVKESVTFSGVLPNADLPQAYAAADLFCISATGTFQSAATLEAMASGLPVVAVDAGALTHLVHHGENGLLYLRGNVEDLAVRLMTLLNDPTASRRMGQRSRGIAAKHDASFTTAAFLGLYRPRLSGSPDVRRHVPVMAVP